MMWPFDSKTECVDCERQIRRREAELHDGRCDQCAARHAEYENNRLVFQRAVERGEAFRPSAQEVDSAVVPAEFRDDGRTWSLQPEFYREYKDGSIRTVDEAIADAEASDHGNVFLVSGMNGQLNFGLTRNHGVCQYVNEDSGHWLYAFTEENLAEQIGKEDHVAQNCPCCGVGMLWYPSRFHIPRRAALAIARRISAGTVPSDVRWLESGDFSLTEQGYG